MIHLQKCIHKTILAIFSAAIYVGYPRIQQVAENFSHSDKPIQETSNRVVSLLSC